MGVAEEAKLRSGEVDGVGQGVQGHLHILPVSVGHIDSHPVGAEAQELRIRERDGRMREMKGMARLSLIAAMTIFGTTLMIKVSAVNTVTEPLVMQPQFRFAETLATMMEAAFQ